MNKMPEKPLSRNILEFFGVYILSMFLVLFALGYSPTNKERFYLSALIIALVIFGAYEVGKNKK